MAKQPKGELVVVGFNYNLLETKVAVEVRTSADRIRERVKKTVEDIIDVGNDLLAVKEALPHGHSSRGTSWPVPYISWSDTRNDPSSLTRRRHLHNIFNLPVLGRK